MVYDDGSEDSTPAILTRLTNGDDRVVGAEANPLPAGWNGEAACL